MSAPLIDPTLIYHMLIDTKRNPPLIDPPLIEPPLISPPLIDPSLIDPALVNTPLICTSLKATRQSGGLVNWTNELV